MNPQPKDSMELYISQYMPPGKQNQFTKGNSNNKFIPEYDQMQLVASENSHYRWNTNYPHHAKIETAHKCIGRSSPIRPMKQIISPGNVILQGFSGSCHHVHQ